MKNFQAIFELLILANSGRLQSVIYFLINYITGIYDEFILNSDCPLFDLVISHGNLYLRLALSIVTCYFLSIVTCYFLFVRRCSFWCLLETYIMLCRFDVFVVMLWIQWTNLCLNETWKSGISLPQITGRNYYTL